MFVIRVSRDSQHVVRHPGNDMYLTHRCPSFVTAVMSFR